MKLLFHPRTSLALILNLIALVPFGTKAQQPDCLVLSCSSNLTAWTCASSASVSYQVGVTNLCADNVVLQCAPPSGSPFPVGTNTVTCRASDDAGRSNACSFTITVRRDTGPPSVACPTNQRLVTCSNGVAFAYSASVTDDCDPMPVRLCHPASGSLFPTGSTTVFCLARDTCGNVGGCSFTVTVSKDETPPTLFCPSNLVVRTCTNEARVEYGASVEDDLDPDVAFVCVPASGSLLPVGSHTVICHASDDCGNTNACEFIVAVVPDLDPPSLTCSTNLMFWTCTNGAVVNYHASASDDGDTNVTLACEPVTGSFLPVGDHLVACQAADACGNRSTCAFLVRVIQDSAPPMVSCPANIVVGTCSNAALVEYEISATDDCDPAVEIICAPPSGNLFLSGVNQVICIASDDCEKTGICFFTVTVGGDITPPVLECPTNLLAWACDGEAMVEFQVGVRDDCSTNVVLVCLPPSGSVFPVGETPIQCEATDAADNLARCQFIVTVRPDIEPPRLTCPTNQVFWSCTNSAVVDYEVFATDDCDPEVGIICLPPTGTSLPSGNHDVVCIAGDECGKTTICFFTVILLQDTTPPVVVCPTNVVAWTCTNAAIATWEVRATDDCDTNVTVTCVPVSGSSLPLGTNSVVCEARDDCGNSASCQFEVLVIRDTTPPVVVCPTNVVAWTCTNAAVGAWEVGATDDCDTNVTVTCVPVSGSSLPLGTNSVVCEARDDCGNSASCQFEVLVIRDTTPPVVVCPTNVVAWTCTNAAVGAWEVGATDDCDTNVTVTCVPVSGSSLPLGTNSVVCEARDDCGNSASCQFEVLVIRDTTPPVVVCPTNVVAWTCTNAAVGAWEVGATDDCDTNVTVTCVPVSGSSLPLGTNSVVCEARDDCGNSASCQFEVLVIRDTTPPVVVCPTNVVAWTCTNAAVGAWEVGATDDCDTNVTVTCVPVSGSSLPLGTNSVVCEARDDCGNSASCQFEVLVIRDTTPPVVVCPTNVVAWTCTNAAVGVWEVGATDDCDTNVTVTCVPVSGSSLPLGTNSVVCEARDDCGNTVSCQFTVVVVRDTMPPVAVCPTNQVIWSCTNVAIATWEVGATDDCDTNVTVTCVPVSGSSLPLGTNSVVCEARDDCGNTVSCQFTVVVVRDTMPPVAVCPTNQVIWSCTNVAIATWEERATDDCDTNVTVTCVPVSGSSLPLGTNSVVCEARDDCGNTASCQFTVVVVRDTMPPVAVCPTNQVIWSCTNVAIATWEVRATDDCDTNVTVTCVPVSGSSLPLGTNSVVCEARDDCGNMASCQFTVVVVRDTTPPVVVCPTNQMIWSCTNAAVGTWEVRATDDCDTNVTVTCVPVSGSSLPLGTNSVVCEARDDCGNMASCQFTVVVVRDTTPPVVVCPTNQMIWSCTNAAVGTWEVRATDDCDTNVTVTCVPVSGSSLPLGTNSVVCEGRDDCGNTASCQFTVVVVRDTMPPVVVCPTNQVIWSCTNVAIATWEVRATDDCDTNVTVTCVPVSGSSLPLGTNSVVCEARDDCGNTASCQFTVVVVRDTTPPVVVCPTNQVIWSCTNLAIATWEVGATDDCDTNVTVTCVPVSGSSLPLGTNSVVCEARDDCGNTASCQFTVVVVRDTTPPVVVCPTNQVIWSCTNLAIATWEVGATDDCDTNVTVTCVPVSGSSLPTGTNSVVCEARDDCGNTASCQFTVVVVRDTMPPTLLCPTNTLAWTCSNTVTVAYEVRATDDCDTNVALLCTPVPGSAFAVGVNTVVCVATDDCGNTAQCEFLIEVVADLQPPRVTCPTNIMTLCTGTNGAQVTFRIETSDDCDTNVAVACTPPSGGFFPVGSTMVRCLAADSCGHTNSCGFTVTVVERTNLTLTVVRDGAKVLICWPVNTCLNYVLEETASLGPPSPIVWTPVAAAAEVRDGRYCVSLDIGAANRFFRLRRLGN